MTIDELRRIVIELEVDHGSDCEVRLAFQPNWPLSFHINRIRYVDGPEDGSQPAAVWITASDSHPYDENPYAPREAWDQE